jgi:hypothetical protein
MTYLIVWAVAFVVLLLVVHAASAYFGEEVCEEDAAPVAILRVLWPLTLPCGALAGLAYGVAWLGLALGRRLRGNS